MEHDKRVYIDMQFNLIEPEPQLALIAEEKSLAQISLRD